MCSVVLWANFSGHIYVLSEAKLCMGYSILNTYGKISHELQRMYQQEYIGNFLDKEYIDVNL